MFTNFSGYELLNTLGIQLFLAWCPGSSVLPGFSGSRRVPAPSAYGHPRGGTPTALVLTAVRSKAESSWAQSLSSAPCFSLTDNKPLKAKTHSQRSRLAWRNRSAKKKRVSNRILNSSARLQRETRV